MKNANDFIGNTDSAILESAVNNCENGIVIIPPRKQSTEPDRDYWLIDRAIIVPENTTIVLQNCKIKLSDKCRDNFFRSANCGFGIDNIEKIKNIHIKGEGLCILEGADHPRATGDASKTLACPCPKKPEDILKYADWVSDEHRKSGELDFWDEHMHSYGTDAGKDGEVQKGDWRGIGILFANAEYFSIENIKIVGSHGWAISLEDCSHGRLEQIEFDASMSKEIDGMLHNTENQDGIDLRCGCHDILIQNITGGTGDDIVALTAIKSLNSDFFPAGTLGRTHITNNDYTNRDADIHDIIIRNIKGYSKGGLCFHVRLLPVNTKIYNIIIDGVIDTSPEGFRAGGVILLGEHDTAYGDNPYDGISNISISNVICDSKEAILVLGYIKNSVITNIINRNPECPVINVVRKDGMKNVATSNLLTIEN